jgi:hypothetical protein
MKDSEIKKIVRRVISEEVNEGATWEGIKGFFRGKGYYYTKYLTELEYILEEMEKEIVSNTKIEKKLQKLKDKVESSSIEKEKKDNIKIMFSRTQQVIQYADRLIQNELYNLKRLKDY